MSVSRAPAHVRRTALTTVAVCALDQLTKWVAFAAVAEGDERGVVFGFSLGQTRNKGIAFGFFSERPVLVLALMAAALAVLIWFSARHSDRPALWLATGLLLGGALGNAIDRVTLGYVRDFISFPGWPSFNLADVAISAGVVVLVLAIERRENHAPEDADGPDGNVPN